ncbi:ATP-dependent Clp protease proteolytic subunit [Celerinatantimonas diazotrophica]|uniref:ATP-dependent Clp protease proteolytic subunit n=1 Tax=Celerinatantimonas diazotrophica TaxID=412034 RepID=A0A4R1KGK7_9GAMM|nr:ATP-dependent Clp protease proteolytic subunit [Celerinatantimonas diazotrophica]TCK63327.1 ATP-dependent protease ClpP protease subunit [Celerinatantimonas diazotrophica]CAG9298471.1 ATP-dependent Clp protease proteolytic subunit [Celerinatantimonas diazotrophica]
MFRTFLCFILLILPVTSFANLTVVGNNNIASNQVKAVKVMYMAPINNYYMSELIAAINQINIQYKQAQHIYLYINTMGGDMNSAVAAYQTIKSSAIPVTTINLATIASAGNVIFCAGSSRLGFKHSQFIFHPISWAFKDHNNNQTLTPAGLANIEEMLENTQQMVTPIYQKCTNFTPTEIKKFFYSESERHYISGNKAITHKLISAYATKMQKTPVNYYIAD